MITRARLSYFGVGFLKVRRYVGTIKGQPVDHAIAILDLQPSPTCQTLGKLLRSAVANAENNNGVDRDNLMVSSVLVDQGPTLKRIQPRARGRAYRILKRSCHVTIEVDLRKGLTLEKLRQEQAAAQKQRGRQKRERPAKAAGRTAARTAAEHKHERGHAAKAHDKPAGKPAGTQRVVKEK
jgi:large subunit ribosomal protein L22